MRQLCALITVSLMLSSFATADFANGQEPPKPGAEHALLKEREGTWDANVKSPDGSSSKATSVNKMTLGGLWLESSFEGSFGGAKFSGKGLDSYDPMKKKYVGVWVDSFSSSPMTMEGTYDAAKKMFVSTGEGPGPDGKPTKYKMTTTIKDKDNHTFVMYTQGGGNEMEMMRIEYVRRR